VSFSRQFSCSISLGRDSGWEVDANVRVLCRTTTELTASFSSWIARLLGLGDVEGVIEVVVRCVSPLSSLCLLDRGSNGEAVVFRIKSRIQRCCKSLSSFTPFSSETCIGHRELCGRPPLPALSGDLPVPHPQPYKAACMHPAQYPHHHHHVSSHPPLCFLSPAL
jgi:hypothetical protein